MSKTIYKALGEDSPAAATLRQLERLEAQKADCSREGRSFGEKAAIVAYGLLGGLLLLGMVFGKS